MEIKVKKLHPAALLPSYATAGAACFDLRAIIDNFGSVRVAFGQPVIFRTGLAFEIPPEHAMFIFSRSGMGFHSDVRLANCVGVIDPDYRGEVKIKLTSDNIDLANYTVSHGDRIAQAAIIHCPRVVFQEVAELSATERGDNGHGSTGR